MPDPDERAADAHDASARDPLARWDAERRRCPVARADDGTWEVLGHPEALTGLRDPATFSSHVTRHLQIPNAMDPPEHGPWRAIVDRYFGPDEVAAFEPHGRQVAAERIDAIVARGAGEAVADLGEPFAVRAQAAFMGWPSDLAAAMADWRRAQTEAVRSGDASQTARLADAFAERVTALLDRRRADGDAAPDDPTTRLTRERIDGRPLSDDEIVSIVRNWTVGELGTIAAGIGVAVHALAHDPALQDALRRDPSRIPAAADEVLRVRDPLVAGRRVATRDVELAGRRVAAGDRLRLVWPAIVRDERVFDAPNRHRLDRDPDGRLVYGAGVHVCPGAPLARLQLRLILEELLTRTSRIGPDPDAAPTVADPPQGGFASVPFRVTP